jgi:hypothetical protein
VFDTSLYVVRLHADATEVWSRVGAAGTWKRSPARHDAHGTWTTIRPTLGAGALAVGFRSSNAGGACLALEERTFTVKRHVQLDRVNAVTGHGRLRVSAVRAGRGCHSLGGGAFSWHFRANGKRRAIGLGNACGRLDGNGRPTRGARVKARFFTILVGTAARRGAPASYLEVRAAHPRRSGIVRFNLSAEVTEFDQSGGAGVPIGVTVIVHYQPGSHPAWRTTVQFGRAFSPTSGHGGSSGSTGAGTCSGLDCGGDGGLGGGDTGLGGGTGDSPAGGGSCSGLDC